MNVIFAASMSVLVCLASGSIQPENAAKGPPSPAQEQPRQPKGTIPAGHPGLVNDPVVDWPKARPEDVKSVDAIMEAFYTIPRGEPKQPRDWDRYRSLFSPDARMIPARPTPEGGATAMFMSITDYISLNKTYFEKGGFMDKEVGRRVETFGHMTQVWSTFESRHKADDPQPYIRGINSVQLLKDGDRWWVVNVFWDFEDEKNPIPAQYLQSGKQ